jgi:hypothetical protein
MHLLPVPAFPRTLQLVDCEVQLADIPRFDFALFHFLPSFFHFTNDAFRYLRHAVFGTVFAQQSRLACCIILSLIYA